MIIPILFLLPLAALAYPYGSCNCGLGSGEDVCNSNNHHHHHKGKCVPLVVRPVDIPKPVLQTPKVVCAPVGGVPPLIPVGGPCSCQNSIVKPAVVPKPACSACSGRVDVSNHHQLTLSQKQQYLFGGGGCGGNVVVHGGGARPILVDESNNNNTPQNPANYVPADAVSLQVAYNLAQEGCHESEDKLSFGFRKLPKEVPVHSYNRRRGNDIPEENLFSLNGQIVELKKKTCASRKSLDEEAIEQLTELAEEEEEANAEYNNKIKQVTLGELGYGLAKIPQPTFIDIKPALGPVEDFGSGSSNCKDGFKRGNVIITQIPRVESVELPPLLPEPCPPENVFLPPPPPAIPPGTLFDSPYTYLSSSSSAASQNLYKKSVFLQKVGCD